MHKPKPVRVFLLLAAALGTISGFLPWLSYPVGAGPSYSALSGQLFPLATWAPLACLAALLLGLLDTFSPDTLPDEVLGFRIIQLVTVCGLITTLVAVGMVQLDLSYETGFGAVLSFLCGVSILCLALLEEHQRRAGTTTGTDLREVPATAPRGGKKAGVSGEAGGGTANPDAEDEGGGGRGGGDEDAASDNPTDATTTDAAADENPHPSTTPLGAARESSTSSEWPALRQGTDDETT